MIDWFVTHRAGQLGHRVDFAIRFILVCLLLCQELGFEVLYCVGMCCPHLRYLTHELLDSVRLLYLEVLVHEI